ncbi:MAG: carboxymuconolactone decarboxylase family protein, partial [Pseudomonadota bacterium]
SGEKQGEVETELNMIAAAMGFAPNSLKLMAHRPEFVRGFAMMAGAVLGPMNKLEPELRQMIAHVTSAAAGCSYCQAHTAHGAERAGLSPEKIDALWTDRDGPLFSERERAAIALADAAGQVPNQATDQHFEDLRRHYSSEEITEIVAVISMFGFLNRWNDTLATPLEDDPRGFAEAHLTTHGWSAGAHS